MKIEKLNEMAGRPVVIKRINSNLLSTELQSGKEQPDDPIVGPQVTKATVDFSDYKSHAITALIPAFEVNGKFVSMETGKIVPTGGQDQVLPVLVGTAITFSDGTRVVYTRGWYQGRYMFFFAENKCKETSTAPNIHAFGEG